MECGRQVTGYVRSLKSGETVFVFKDDSIGQQLSTPGSLQKCPAGNNTASSCQQSGCGLHHNTECPVSNSEEQMSSMADSCVQTDSSCLFNKMADGKKYHSIGTETDLTVVGDYTTVEALLKWALTICSSKNGNFSEPGRDFQETRHHKRRNISPDSSFVSFNNNSISSEADGASGLEETFSIADQVGLSFPLDKMPSSNQLIQGQVLGDRRDSVEGHPHQQQAPMSISTGQRHGQGIGDSMRMDSLEGQSHQPQAPLSIITGQRPGQGIGDSMRMDSLEGQSHQPQAPVSISTCQRQGQGIGDNMDSVEGHPHQQQAPVSISTGQRQGQGIGDSMDSLEEQSHQPQAPVSISTSQAVDNYNISNSTIHQRSSTCSENTAHGLEGNTSNQGIDTTMRSPEIITAASCTPVRIGPSGYPAHEGTYHEAGHQPKPRQHTRDKPFQCNVCGERFTQKGTLARHFRFHVDPRPYHCKTCGKKFLHSRNLKSHNAVHTKERPFQCTVCSKRFSLSWNLKTHMRIHTKEQPYKCTLCEKKFTYSNCLKNHMVSHRPEDKAIQASMDAADIDQSSSSSKRNIEIRTMQVEVGSDNAKQGVSNVSREANAVPGYEGVSNVSRVVNAVPGYENQQPSEIASTDAVFSIEKQQQVGHSNDTLSASNGMRERLAQQNRTPSVEVASGSGRYPSDIPDVCQGGFVLVNEQPQPQQSPANNISSSEQVVSPSKGKFPLCETLPQSRLLYGIQQSPVDTGDIKMENEGEMSGLQTMINTTTTYRVDDKEFIPSLSVPQIANTSFRTSDIVDTNAMPSGMTSEVVAVTTPALMMHSQPRGSATGDIGHLSVRPERQPYECNTLQAHSQQGSATEDIGHLSVHSERQPYECYTLRTHTQQGSAVGYTSNLSVHPDEQPYESNTIRAYSQQEIAIGDMGHLLVHPEGQPYECNICGKAFSSYKGMKRHAVVHSNARPYQCNVCLKKFSLAWNLKAHMRIHTKEQPYKCNICDERFTYSSYLKKHFALHGAGSSNSVEPQ